MVLRDLSEYITLPFIAAFDAPLPLDVMSQTPGNPKQSRAPQKRITYIALADKIMLQVVNLYLYLPPEAMVDVYNDGTLEAVFSVSLLQNKTSSLSFILFYRRRILCLSK